MSPDDIAVVLLAGHGILRPDRTAAFLTSGARQDVTSVKENGVSWEVLGPSLSAAKGRVIVLVDACYSGAIDSSLLAPNGQLATDLFQRGQAGALVFSAAKGRQASYEPGGRALFTTAVTAALRSADTDLDRDRFISASELIAAVTRRVSDASGGAQVPWVARREIFGDFQLAPAPAPSGGQSSAGPDQAGRNKKQPRR